MLAFTPCEQLLMHTGAPWAQSGAADVQRCSREDWKCRNPPLIWSFQVLGFDTLVELEICMGRNCVICLLSTARKAIGELERTSKGHLVPLLALSRDTHSSSRCSEPCPALTSGVCRDRAPITSLGSWSEWPWWDAAVMAAGTKWVTKDTVPYGYQC